MLKTRIYYSFLLTMFFAFLCSCNKTPEIKSEQSEKFIKVFGGSGYDYATDIIEFESGYALTGTIQTSDSANQAFLIATDNFGNEMPWSPVLFGGILDDIGNKIFRLKSGDFIVVGTKVLSRVAADSCDILVTKIGTNGVIKWIKTFGGSLNDEGLFGLETVSNNIVFGGYTKSFGNGAKDIWLYKINSEGDSIWSSTHGYSGNDMGTDIVELNNSFYVLGTTQLNSSKKVIFIIQTDSNGKASSVNQFGISNGSLEGFKLIVLPNSEKDLFILGQYIQDNTGNKSLYTLQIKNYDLYQTVRSRFLPANENEYAADVLVSQNDISIFCTSVRAENAVIKIHKLEVIGDSLDSTLINNNGQQTAKAALITNDSKICITGSNKIGNNSQIILMKGSF